MGGKKYDTWKIRYELLPPECLQEVAKILTFWAEKYGANNWQWLENFDERYYWALERHLQAWRMWKNIDPESWQHHLAHASTNAMFLLWKAMQK